jgi:hypothetical protein
MRRLIVNADDDAMDEFERLRVIVLGHIFRGPPGGVARHNLQHLPGPSALGREVCFVEDRDDCATPCDVPQALWL